MSPDEVLGKLSELGVNITRKTLLNYEAYGLPKPERGSGGRGVGRFTDYPPNTVEHAFSIYNMLNSSNYPSSFVMEIVKIIPDFADNPFAFIGRGWGYDSSKKCTECEYIEKCNMPKNNGESELVKKANELFNDYLDRNFLSPILIYVTYLFIARYNLDQSNPINIFYLGNSCSGISNVIINKIHTLCYDDVSEKWIYEVDHTNENMFNMPNDPEWSKDTNEKGIAKFIFVNRLTGLILSREVMTRLNKK